MTQGVTQQTLKGTLISFSFETWKCLKCIVAASHWNIDFYIESTPVVFKKYIMPNAIMHYLEQIVQILFSLEKVAIFQWNTCIFFTNNTLKISSSWGDTSYMHFLERTLKVQNLFFFAKVTVFHWNICFKYNPLQFKTN